MIAIAAAALAGLAGGAIGGAAGAMWVVETMAKPQFSPKVKNAVVSYEMPSQGARPVDLAGIRKPGTPLHPCLIGFMEEQRELLPHAKWREVRIDPYFRADNDIINEIAFAKRSKAITRQNRIIVRVLDPKEGLDSIDERVMFHELAHVDQYASGRLDLPDYAASAANAYARGRDAHDNAYEIEAEANAHRLRALWWKSDWRRRCHADVPSTRAEDGGGYRRADSERPLARYAIFDPQTQQYEIIEHRLHART